MFPLFQSSGKILDFRRFWNIIENGFMVSWMSYLALAFLLEYHHVHEFCFHIMTELFLACPCCQKWYHWTCSVYVLDFGRALLFCRGWHCLRKNYFSKLVINLSFTSRGRIIGVFAIDEGFKYRPKGFWWRRWISWFGGQLAMECSLENLTNHLQPLVIARNRFEISR